MKNRTVSVLLCVLVCAFVAHSFETSADSSNPFNEFLNPTKGVDLYSGNVVHSQNLFTLSGRNGLDIDVTLYYSSNVYNNVRSRNDINPTSWVGLGWRLGYGAIVSCHKNTIFMDDDEYEYISPTSDKEKMFQKYDEDSPPKYGNDAFYVKSNPFLKFRRIIGYDADLEDSVVQGWEITTASGKKYKYGDLTEYNPDDTSNATWKTFCWYGEKTFSPKYDLTGTSHHYNYGYVGNGFSGDSSNYKEFGYRWDLSQIEDVFNNKIRFYYTQEYEGVSANVGSNWKSYIKYTKSSYISEIVNPQGQKVKFFKGEKYECEYLDSYTFYEEGDTGDAFMEYYETKFLDSIEVYNINGRIMKKVDLSYDTGSVPVDSISHYTKRRLKEIRYIKVPEEGVVPPPGGDAENVYDVRFAYNMSNDSVRYDDVNYHYGALDTIKSSSGGLTAFTYSRKELPEDSCKKKLFLNADDETGNEYGIFGFTPGNAPGNNVTSTVGKLREGIEYIVYCVNQWNRNLTCILWNGKKWENAWVNCDGTDYELNDWGGMGSTSLKATAGRDFFVVQRAIDLTDQGRYNYLRVFDWDKEDKKWKGGLIIDNTQGGCGAFDSSIVFCGSNYFVVAYSKSENYYPTYIKIFYKYNSEWKASNQYKITSGSDHPSIKKIVGTDKYFVVIYNDMSPEIAPQYVKVFNASCKNGLGEHWSCTFDHFFNGDSGVDVSAGENFFIVANKKSIYPAHPKQEIFIYNWSGFQWQKTFNKEYEVHKLEDNSQRALIKNGKNYAIIGYNHHERIFNYHKYYPYNIEIHTWTGKIEGNTWEDDFKFEFNGPVENVGGVPFYCGLNINSAGDIVAATVGRIPSDNYPNKLTIYKWEYIPVGGGLWNWQWREQVFEGGDLEMDGLIRVAPSAKYVIALNGEKQAFSKVKGFSWDGVRFNNNYNNEEELGGSDFITYSNYDDIVSANYGCINAAGGNYRVYIFKRHLDDIANPLFSYIVTKKVVKDGINPAGITTNFAFDTINMNFDTERNSCKNEKVDVAVEGNKWGKTVSFFHNEFFSEGLDKYRLNGYNYKDDLFRYTNGSFQLISHNIDTFDVFKKQDWPDDIHKIRLIKRESMVDKLTTKKTFDFTGSGCEYEYPDKNGLPRIVRNYNSDDNIRTDFTLYAYEVGKYENDFQSRNMLTQPAMNLTLEESPQNMLTFCPYNSWYNQGIGFEYIRTAEAITWSDGNNPDSVWTPHEMYLWRVDCDSTGAPIDSMINFNFENPSANQDSNWVLELSLSRYNKYGQIVEFKKPNSDDTNSYTFYSKIYRNDLGNVLASVVNAKYNECAFYTCDYWMATVSDLDNLDRENGWVKGTIHQTPFQGYIILTDGNKHFGNYSLYVSNAKGPTNTIGGILPNKDYVFSAWVYPVNSNPITMGAQIVGGADLSEQLTITPNEWHLIVNTLTKEELSGVSSGDELEIWTGNRSSESMSHFYIDDIRFYPKDALATTTYYHPQWNQEILTVDANNNPSKKKEYDGLRRPVKWYKMRHNESNILVREKEYHHRGFDE